MEYQNLINLLDNIITQLSKLISKKARSIENK